MPFTAAMVDHIGVASKLSSNMRTLHWVTKIGPPAFFFRCYTSGWLQLFSHPPPSQLQAR